MPHGHSTGTARANGVELREDRLLRPGAPSLEFVEVAPAGAPRGSPLLFLHGAFSGAWCWSERFVSPFAAAGFATAAVSLRGHGRSGGRNQLSRASIEDFLSDVTCAVAAMRALPVVVAHSFGGYLAQLLLGRLAMRALVLISTLPPDGLALVGPRLALSDISLWLEGVGGSTGRVVPTKGSLQRLFGDRIRPAERQRFARQMVPESPLALAEAHLPRWVTPARAAGVPTLVLHGEHDHLIWPATSGRTALYHGAEYALVPSAGHFMMLEPAADQAIAVISPWLTRLG
jgi:pimeloyl-ACP methyl ester carboxylesterase